MKVIVFGAGALGSVVGGLLTRRHRVTLVGRQAHMQAIEESGLAISGAVEGVFLPEVRTELDPKDDADAVVVTVKANDLEAALMTVRPLVQRGAALVVIENGLTLLRAVAKENRKAVIGVATLGATYSSPGKVIYAGEGEFYFGSLIGDVDVPRQIAEAFSSVGLDSYLSQDITKDVWAKAIVNASVNPLTAIVRCRNGELLKDESLMLLWRDLCLEGVAAAKSCGIDIEPEEELEKVEEALRKTASNKSSMLQDIEKGRKTEIDAISGEIVRSARERGIETRMNLAVSLIVKGLEKRR